MAARLGEEGTLHCAHESAQIAGRRLRHRRRIRLHHGSPRAAVSPQAASRAEDAALRVAHQKANLMKIQRISPPGQRFAGGASLWTSLLLASALPAAAGEVPPGFTGHFG